MDLTWQVKQELQHPLLAGEFSLPAFKAQQSTLAHSLFAHGLPYRDRNDYGQGSL